MALFNELPSETIKSKTSFNEKELRIARDSGYRIAARDYPFKASYNYSLYDELQKEWQRGYNQYIEEQA